MRIDILQKKERKLIELNQRAESSINTFKTALTNLKAVNEEIDSSVAEINDYINSLEATKSNMEQNRKENEAIINNFSKLLNVKD